MRALVDGLASSLADDALARERAARDGRKTSKQSAREPAVTPKAKEADQAPRKLAPPSMLLPDRIRRLASEWNKLDRSAEGYVWQRAEKSYALQQACEEDKKQAKAEKRPRVAFCLVVKNLIDDAARTTIHDDLNAWRVRVAAGLTKADLPPRSYSAFVAIGAATRRARELALSRLQPAEAEARNKLVQKEAKRLARAVATGEQPAKAAVAWARKLNSTDKKQDADDDEEDLTPPTVRAYPLYDPEEFQGMVRGMYEGDVYRGASVGVVMVRVADWEPQAVVSAISTPQLQRGLADAFPPRGDLWVCLSAQEPPASAPPAPATDQPSPAKEA
jgi:hypothetical protein